MKTLSNLLFIAIFTSLFIALFGDIALKPSNYLLGHSEDGIKNYFTFFYHVKVDTDWIQFGGMNMPYGENLIFTDCQPILTWICKLIGWKPSFEEAVGFINTLILLSFIVGSIAYFRLCILLGFNPVFSAVYTALIIFLSPQILRFSGHYSLAYIHFLPVFLILLHKEFYQNSFSNWTILISLYCIFHGFIHLYLFAIAALTSFVFWILVLFYHANKHKQALLNVLLSVILPAIVLIVFQKLTDSVTDRPSSPYGFLAYRSYWESIFLPCEMWLGNWISKLFIKIQEVPWEGRAYIGMPATIFVIYYLFYFLKQTGFTKSLTWIRQTKFEPSFLNLLLLTSIVLLIYSLGVPFVWKLDFLLDYLGPLQQFRGIGRFAWLFFYVINLFVLRHLNTSLEKQQWSIVIVTLILIGIDIGQFYDYWRKEVGKQNSYSTLTKILDQKDTSSIQGILPLPGFHIGSEAISFTPPNFNNMLFHSILASAKLEKTIYSVCLSRTSLSQTLSFTESILNTDTAIVFLRSLLPNDEILILTDNHSDEFTLALLKQGNYPNFRFGNTLAWKISKNQWIDLLQKKTFAKTMLF
ncbi:MAG: hypothetical protein NZ108_04815 [Bacteroidia bacterium]|nr:hypothetical protein [Bacteroidia bacterium]